MVKEVTQEELDEIIKNKKIVIVDFSAEWCGPCKSLGRVLNSKVVPKLEGMDDVELVKVDTDKNRDLSMALNIQGVPTMMFFVEGKRVVFETDRGQEDRIVGFHPQIDQIIFDFIEQVKKQLAQQPQDEGKVDVEMDDESTEL